MVYSSIVKCLSFQIKKKKDCLIWLFLNLRLDNFWIFQFGFGTKRFEKYPALEPVNFRFVHCFPLGTGKVTVRSNRGELGGGVVRFLCCSFFSKQRFPVWIANVSPGPV